MAKKESGCAKETRQIFKLIFETDVELFETRETGKPQVFSDLRVNTKKVGDVRELRDAFDERVIPEQLEYLEKHLSDEIKTLVEWLYHVEGTFNRWHRGDSETRDLLLTKWRKAADQRARKRLEVDLGRPASIAPMSEIIEFKNECVGLYKKLRQNRRGKITKTDLANAYFRSKDGPNGRSNLIRDFNALLKKYLTSLEEIETEGRT